MSLTLTPSPLPLLGIVVVLTVLYFLCFLCYASGVAEGHQRGYRDGHGETYERAHELGRLRGITEERTRTR